MFLFTSAETMLVYYFAHLYCFFVDLLYWSMVLFLLILQTHL